MTNVSLFIAMTQERVIGKEGSTEPLWKLPSYQRFLNKSASGNTIVTDAALSGHTGRVFVTGPTAPYEELLARADELHITTVHADVEGDLYFPEWDRREWERTMWAPPRKYDPADEHPTSFALYQRKTPPST